MPSVANLPSVRSTPDKLRRCTGQAGAQHGGKAAAGSSKPPPRDMRAQSSLSEPSTLATCCGVSPVSMAWNTAKLAVSAMVAGVERNRST